MDSDISGFQVSGNLHRRVRRRALELVRTPVQRLLTPMRALKNRGRTTRCLEIGPGARRIPGFETLNLVGGPQVDYVVNAASKLPFPDGTFEIIYASHVIEHIPWYQLEATLAEWARKLRPGGVLEIWTPDGLKIAKAFVDAEETGTDDFAADGWWRFNDRRDPCVWFSGRMFSYGDGTGKLGHYNWHHSVLSERFLVSLLKSVGLTDVRRMTHDEIRGADHGWINLGVRGRRR
jgi:SAM-dependent methyltransferase